MARPELRVRIGADLQQFNAGMQKLRGSVQSFRNVAVGLFAGIGVAGLATGVIAQADAYTRLTGQLRVATKSTEELKRAQEGIFRISQTTSQSLEATTALYAKLSMSSEKLAKDQGRLLGLTEVINKALLVSSAGTAEAAAATQQFSQAMASGVLRGEEFNSIMENAPRLARAIADGLGVPIGALRKLAEEGKLTSDVVIRAIEAQAGAIDTEFRKMPVTVSQAMQQVKNSLMQMIGEADQAQGSTRQLANAIQGFARTLDDPGLRDGISTLLAGIVKIAEVAITAASNVTRLTKTIAEDLAASINGIAKDDLRRQRDLISAKQKMLRDLESGGSTFGSAESRRRRAAEIRDELKAMQAEYSRNATMFGPKVNIIDPRNAESMKLNPFGDGKGGAAGGPIKIDLDTDKAGKKADALREKLKRLQAQHEENLRKLREEEIKREEALQEQLDDVQIALLRATGRSAEADFMEIDAKYRELLATMRANSNTEGERLISELIDVSKARAKMEEMGQVINDAMTRFGGVEARATAQAAAGLISQGQAQRDINAARRDALSTLRDMRAEQEAFNAGLSGPALQTGLSALDQLDTQIAEIVATQRTVGQQVGGLLQDSFTGYTQEIVSSLGDAERAFDNFKKKVLAGLAEMFAKRLAMGFANMGQTGGFWGGFTGSVYHTGGVVGAGGIRRHNLNPLLFGAAPRYHGGGFAGLGSGEVAAVLKKGEEVLTERDPRHTRNGGRASGGGIRDIIINVEGEATARTEQRDTGDGSGMRDLVVFIENTARGAFGKDIANDDGIAKQLKLAYGLKRQGVSRG